MLKGSVISYLVHLTGLEPAHRRYQILNLARLPIPPQVHFTAFDIITKAAICQEAETAADADFQRRLQFNYFLTGII